MHSSMHSSLNFNSASDHFELSAYLRTKNSAVVLEEPRQIVNSCRRLHKLTLARNDNSLHLIRQ